MGNTCVGPSISKNGIFQSVSAAMWRSRAPDDTGSTTNGEIAVETPTSNKEPESHMPVLSNPPEQMTIPKDETKKEQPVKPKKQMKRVSSAGLRTESVLQRKTGNLKEFFTLGKKLGQGQFGTTFHCVEKGTGNKYACKSIAKRKLLTEEDVEDVRREIQIMHHLSGHPNIIAIKGAYEDAVFVHVVMELCAGGELFDRIIQRGHYTERKAAELTRTIVGVVEACHSLGVMHRDLKPENFLLVDHKEDSLLKTIDFGLSIFFKPGETFNDVVGSPYYVAPEVLKKRYGPEADVWSAGVMVYILLSGEPPFWAESEQGIFEQVLHGDLDFSSDPWPSISESAKDLVRRMLIRDPRRRLTVREVLSHPWVQDGVAPDKPLDSAVLSRMKQFSSMNKLKKLALRGEPGFLLAHQLIRRSLEVPGEPFIGMTSQVSIVSAHRTPELMFSYPSSAQKRGILFIIAGAGGAAHLPVVSMELGMVAALTPLPVIGVPVRASSLDGLDSLLSIVQMPRGVPVATVAINNATNAGLLAVRMLGVGDSGLQSRMAQYQEDTKEAVLEKAENLQKDGWENFSNS